MHDVMYSKEKTREAGKSKVETHDDKEPLIEVTDTCVSEETMVTSLQYTDVTNLKIM